MIPAPLPSLSPAQRAFVDAAQAHGATAPDAALPLAELPRLSSAELAELVEAGLVREATNRRYYLFWSRRALVEPAVRPASANLPRWIRRYWQTFLFWMLLILIPILVEWLNRRH